MSSRRLVEWLQQDSQRLLSRGHVQLPRQLVRLQHLSHFSLLEPYLHGLEKLRQQAREAGEVVWVQLARYLIARNLAFPMDRPGDALEDLVHLNAELANPPLCGGILHQLCELELLRAYHKMDAPAYRDPILRGLEHLWQALDGDPGPRLEILDIYWRTSFWCGDAKLMRQGLSMAAGAAELVVGSWPYWEGRALGLEGRHAEAVAILQGQLEEIRPDQDEDGIWRLYVLVELADQEGRSGQLSAALERLQELRGRAAASADPMLLWDLARVEGGLRQLAGEEAAAIRAWQEGLGVLAGLGLDRLRAEFALHLGETSQQAGQAEPEAAGRKVLAELWPQLRSRGELEPRRRALGW